MSLVDDQKLEQSRWRPLVLFIVDRADRVRQRDDDVVLLELRPVGGSAGHLVDRWAGHVVRQDADAPELVVRAELLGELAPQLLRGRKHEDALRRLRGNERRRQGNRGLACAGRDTDYGRLIVAEAPVGHYRAECSELRAPPGSPAVAEKVDTALGIAEEVGHLLIFVQRADGAGQGRAVLPMSSSDFT